MGKAAAHILSAHLTIAASSITSKETASERPASSVVGTDVIDDPFTNSSTVAVPKESPRV